MIRTALAITAALLIFALGWLVGAGEALRLKERDAIDQGFAVRTPEGEFRWRTTEELERKPARRVRGPDDPRER
jgi:hypothetical protein